MDNFYNQSIKLDGLIKNIQQVIDSGDMIHLRNLCDDIQHQIKYTMKFKHQIEHAIKLYYDFHQIHNKHFLYDTNLTLSDDIIDENILNHLKTIFKDELDKITESMRCLIDETYSYFDVCHAIGYISSYMLFDEIDNRLHPSNLPYNTCCYSNESVCVHDEYKIITQIMMRDIKDVDNINILLNCIIENPPTTKWKMVIGYLGYNDNSSNYGINYDLTINDAGIIMVQPNCSFTNISYCTDICDFYQMLNLY